MSRKDTTKVLRGENINLTNMNDCKHTKLKYFENQGHVICLDCGFIWSNKTEYIPTQPTKVDPVLPNDNWTWTIQNSPYTGGTSNPCLWDSMPETYPGSGIKIGNLYCGCPKCSPQYLT